MMLDRSFREGGEEFGQQAWLRLPAGAKLCADLDAESGRAWVKIGHLSLESLRSDAFFRLDLTDVDGPV